MDELHLHFPVQAAITCPMKTTKHMARRWHAIHGEWQRRAPASYISQPAPTFVVARIFQDLALPKPSASDQDISISHLKISCRQSTRTPPSAPSSMIE